MTTFESNNCKKRRISKAVETSASSDDVTQNKVKRKRTPKFRLKAAGLNAVLTSSNTERIPLMLTDIQHLLLHSLLGNLNLSEPPRWYVLEQCNSISQSTCLIIEGVSLKHYEENKQSLTHLNRLFEDYVEILTPSVYNGSLVQEVALVPLSEADKEIVISKYGSMNLAIEARKDLMVMMKAVFPIVEGENNNVVESIDKFPRTQLILSAWQLVEENFPVPLKGKLKDSYSDYIMTKDEYQPVTPDSPIFGLDCEMCITVVGSELTRVSIVNEKYEVVYESFVKPLNKITDYLTRYSGITKSTLNDVTTRLTDVQKDIREVLPPDAILVGQSLNMDLHALKMIHPYVIDTSCIYNFTGERTRKPKLKTLAKEFLNEDIQNNKKGHCSIEDAVSALKLVKLKLSKDIEFGDAVHTNRTKYKENITKMNKTPQLAFSIFNHMIDQKKTSLIVGCDDITGEYHSYITQAKDNVCNQFKKAKPKKLKLTTVDDAEEVISSISEATKNYNFCMAHLKMTITEADESNSMQVIDRWIETIYNNIQQHALFVVVFGGTTCDNGVAFMRIRNQL